MTGEIAVFAACFAAGALSGVLAAILLLAGKGSRVARAVFDLLTPLAMGAIFFFTLRRAASGAFRLYSLVAFLLGALSAGWLLRRLSPFFKRLLARVIVPIKSLERRVSARVERLLLPLRNRIASRRERRRENRLKARAIAAENKRLRPEKRQKKKEIPAVSARKKRGKDRPFGSRPRRSVGNQS